MKHFKEEIIRDIFNDAVVVTTKEHYYYASDSEKKQHKIDMINHGFEDSGQVVKKLRDISFCHQIGFMILMFTMDAISNKKL